MQATITLDTTITRGETTISEITVRKPDSGALRGQNLNDLLRMDVNALIKVLPRITSPSLTEAEVAKMDPADLLQFGTEVSNFLLPKRLKEEASLSE